MLTSRECELEYMALSMWPAGGTQLVSSLYQLLPSRTWTRAAAWGVLVGTHWYWPDWSLETSQTDREMEKVVLDLLERGETVTRPSSVLVRSWLLCLQKTPFKTSQVRSKRQLDWPVVSLHSEWCRSGWGNSSQPWKPLDHLRSWWMTLEDVYVGVVLFVSIITCNSEPGHHLGERISVHLTLVQPTVLRPHWAYWQLPLHSVRRHVDRNTRVLQPDTLSQAQPGEQCDKPWCRPAHSGSEY